ncbi:hypothetical protein [Bradyrhizobium oligotrophicum]|uniref:PD-(D/E)XK nuclease domain-containing protein n=1 Tax=Bradyrhizobium oligotrophicum TaxID=44255 RepID=UPI003EBBD4C6
MNSGVVKSAVGALEKILSKAKDALWGIEREVFGDPGYGNDGIYDYPRAAMAATVEQLYDTLLVVLEAAEMPDTRNSLVKAFHDFKSKGLETTKDYEEYQTCESPALVYFENLIRGLRISIGEAVTSEEAWTLNRLESMLRDTAALVHRRGEPPANEIDLQKILHDYLSASFPDFRHNPPIGGTLKTFKPDCGIASVGAAIEFKFVRTKEEVAVAGSGIFEDTAGYKGSKDWTRFYSVIYQAEPFMLESHLASDLKRVGAATWKGFVVNGPTNPSKSKRKTERGPKKTK